MRGRRLMVVAALAAAMVLATVATALAVEGEEVPESEASFQCYALDGETCCLGVGFVAYRPGTPEWETWKQGVLGDTRSTPGDESTVEGLRRRAAMPERERREMEQQEIQAAIGAVGRIKLVDLLADGLPVPEGFFARYPSLGIAEGSPMAEAMSAAASRAREVGLLQALWEANPAVVAGLPTDPEHDESLWTGDGPPLYPGESSEPIAGITDPRLNLPRSAVDPSAVGIYGAPIVEHVRLLKQYFTYLRHDHGGHFQTGRGYSYATEKFGIFEPYDERDWTSGGYCTGKRQYVPFKNLWDATRTHRLHNMGV